MGTQKNDPYGPFVILKGHMDTLTRWDKFKIFVYTINKYFILAPLKKIKGEYRLNKYKYVSDMRTKHEIAKTMSRCHVRPKGWPGLHAEIPKDFDKIIKADEEKERNTKTIIDDDGKEIPYENIVHRPLPRRVGLEPSSD